jgi:hypothetical protein
VSAKAEERIITERRQVQSGPALKTYPKEKNVTLTRKKMLFPALNVELTQMQKVQGEFLFFSRRFPVDKMNQIS